MKCSSLNANDLQTWKNVTQMFVTWWFALSEAQKVFQTRGGHCTFIGKSNINVSSQHKSDSAFKFTN